MTEVYKALLQLGCEWKILDSYRALPLAPEPAAARDGNERAHAVRWRRRHRDRRRLAWAQVRRRSRASRRVTPASTSRSTRRSCTRPTT